MKIDRRKLARCWDVSLMVAGLIVAQLATDPDSRAWLASLGGWVTTAIGVVNILLNRVPKLLTDDTDRAGV